MKGNPMKRKLKSLSFSKHLWLGGEQTFILFIDALKRNESIHHIYKMVRAVKYGAYQSNSTMDLQRYNTNEEKKAPQAKCAQR